MLGEGDAGTFVKSYNNLQHSVTKPKCGQFVTMGVERDRPLSDLDISDNRSTVFSSHHLLLTLSLDVFCTSTSNDVLPQPRLSSAPE